MSPPRPTKTFWVCLIAYVQALIVIKLINRSNLWWNKELEVLGTRWFADTDGYNTFDIIILILIFFHRVILKYFGLWKYENQVNPIPPGSYIISDMDDRTRELVNYQNL
jgi:hypothetical protein